MGLVGILLSLGLLMYLAYRGLSVIFIAPILALVAVLFHPGAPLLASYTQIFMPALGKYLLMYFPIFILGSVFGKIMADSGYAAVIGNWIANKVGSRHAILAVVAACALLTYGGVSLFVVAFCIYPIALGLFSAANLPRRLIPGSIALGSFTFTMTAFPGTPSIQNAIPMPFFGTNTYAAPGLGLIGSVLMLVLGMMWLKRVARKSAERGEGFTADPRASEATQNADLNIPVWKAFLPLIIVVILNYLMTHYWIPSWNTDYLAENIYGATSVGKVAGLWALIAAISCGLIFAMALAYKNLKNPVQSLNDGAMGSLLPIFNTATEVGYGATIAALPSFAIIKNAVLSVTPDKPLVSEAIAINALAGITGSASGGLSIALETLGQHYLNIAQQIGMNPDVLHRVASMSSGGLDTLPHNGAVITLLSICALTHKDSYKDIFVVSALSPVLVTCVIVVLGTAFGSF